MSGASERHNLIAGNLYTLIRSQIRHLDVATIYENVELPVK